MKLYRKECKKLPEVLSIIFLLLFWFLAGFRIFME